MIEEKAKEYYKNLWSYPPNERELAEFAEIILKQFIEELEESVSGIAWNYGFDAVIFQSRSLNGKLSLKEMKEKYLERNDKSNSIESHGAGDKGSSMGDQEAYMEAKQSKSPAEIQEQSKERHGKTDSEEKDS